MFNRYMVKTSSIFGLQAAKFVHQIGSIGGQLHDRDSCHYDNRSIIPKLKFYDNYGSLILKCIKYNWLLYRIRLLNEKLKCSHILIFFQLHLQPPVYLSILLEDISLQSFTASTKYYFPTTSFFFFFNSTFI